MRTNFHSLIYSSTKQICSNALCFQFLITHINYTPSQTAASSAYGKALYFNQMECTPSCHRSDYLVKQQRKQQQFPLATISFLLILLLAMISQGMDWLSWWKWSSRSCYLDQESLFHCYTPIIFLLIGEDDGVGSSALDWGN